MFRTNPHMVDVHAFARALGSEVADLRGCLIATPDGRVLGVHSSDGWDVEAAWVRAAALGACTSAIVRFDGETWCLVRSYMLVAFAVLRPAPNPQRVIGRMERLLAEQAGDQDIVELQSPASEGDVEAPDDDDVDRESLVRELSRLQEMRRTADG